MIGTASVDRGGRCTTRRELTGRGAALGAGGVLAACAPSGGDREAGSSARARGR